MQEQGGMEEWKTFAHISPLKIWAVSQEFWKNTPRVGLQLVELDILNQCESHQQPRHFVFVERIVWNGGERKEESKACQGKINVYCRKYCLGLKVDLHFEKVENGFYQREIKGCNIACKTSILDHKTSFRNIWMQGSSCSSAGTTEKASTIADGFNNNLTALLVTMTHTSDFRGSGQKIAIQWLKLKASFCSDFVTPRVKNTTTPFF